MIDNGRMEGFETADRHRSLSLIPDRYDESADGTKKLAASQTMESDRSVNR